MRYPVAVVLTVVTLLSACASTTAESASESADSEPPASGNVASGASPGASAGASGCEEGDAPGECQIVPSMANIFGAGHDEPPAPAGGGAGVLPPMWEIPPDASSLVISEAAGTVTPTPFAEGNGPDGDPIQVTDIGSWGGISGIVHRKSGMFLVGVFLTDESPVDGQHPERLGFTDNDDFTELAPLIAQTFYVGDGGGRIFVVPEGATRLFLGFADASEFNGDPGWYGNNTGSLQVTVDWIARDG